MHPVVERLLRFACERPLRKSPGEEMFYDTLNYEVLGEIIRRVSGQPLPEFYRGRIFDPLGMTDSYLTVPDALAHRIPRVRAEGAWARFWDVPYASIPGASLGGCSTARDLAVFGQAFLDGGRSELARILGRASVNEMIKNQIPGVPGTTNMVERHDEASWGYGWAIASHEKWNGDPTLPLGTFHHGGASGPYLWCDPAFQLVGVFLAPMATLRADGFPHYQLDLFANAVMAAIND